MSDNLVWKFSRLPNNPAVAPHLILTFGGVWENFLGGIRCEGLQSPAVMDCGRDVFEAAMPTLRAEYPSAHLVGDCVEFSEADFASITARPRE